MKQLFTILALAVMTISLHAQTVLTYQNHAINPGDNHHFVITNNSEPGADGASQIWDFSQLTTNGSLTSKMFDATQKGHKQQLIPEATAIIQENNNKFFFNVGKERVEHYGTVSCGNTVIHYNQPFVKMEFPFSYGSIKAGEFSGVAIYKNGNTAPLMGSYELEGDAYGTLILPNDIEIKNVLRLKTTRTRTHANCAGNSVVTYRWYTDNVRYPLLTIIQSATPNNTHTIRTAYFKDAAEAIKAAEEGDDEAAAYLRTLSGEVSLDASPNPFIDETRLEYFLPVPSEVTIMVYSVTGGLMVNASRGEQEAGNHTFTIRSVEHGIKPGMHIVKLITNGTEIEKRIIMIE